MRIYELTRGRGRKYREYFLNANDAERDLESCRRHGIRSAKLRAIDIEQSKSINCEITEDKVSPSLIGRVVDYDDLGHTIKAVVVRVCTTYPNVGLTVKPLEPSRHHFGDPFEQISFGVRAPFKPNARLTNL